MKAVLDDKIFFSEKSFELEVKSPQRSIIQRSAAGLDGQINIDLGFARKKTCTERRITCQKSD